MASTRSVVILGCGVSGQNTAKLLAKDKKLNVTIITACNFIEWPIAMPYVFVHPERHADALAPNPKEFQVPGVTYKYGVVEEVAPQSKKVVLKDGSEVKYDALVVAAGFLMPLVYPKAGQSLAERKAEVKDLADKIKAASTVAIGGGGSVSLEIAGNIKAVYPDKTVKLVAKALLARFAESSRKEAEQQIQNMGIEIVKITGHAPTEPNLSAGSMTIDGKIVNYDLYLPGFSQGPNTGFFGASSDSVLDEEKRLKVNKYLQSDSYPEVFAIGTGNSPESWIGIPKLEGQWATVAANVSALLAKKELKLHKESSPGMKQQPAIYIGHGSAGYGILDCSGLPAPLKCCLCMGYCGFPFCPPVCCWSMMGPCTCGYCGQGHNGPGLAKTMEKMQFVFAAKNYNGMGKPEQQTMQ